WSLLLNLLLCASTALLCEALLLTLRAQPLRTALNDGSALVTAVLLAAALPTLAPWWLPVVATSVAIGIGKQAFGGVGR
ncbi:electron transport complex subunit RsxD, partial [Enterobacter mori]